MSALARVQRAARKLERSRAELHQAIAAAAGEHSHRAIGEAAGLSHGRITQIIKEVRGAHDHG